MCDTKETFCLSQIEALEMTIICGCILQHFIKTSVIEGAGCLSSIHKVILTNYSAPTSRE